jgi:hypothetical protein
MTNTYRTHGSLTGDVNDFETARDYLRESDMTQYVKHASFKGLEDIVHNIQWNLLGVDTWEVIVITNRELTAEESTGVSEWISGQNSDGLGEGFEQQEFAEHEDFDGEYSMSSFDWHTNKAILTLVK